MTTFSADSLCSALALPFQTIHVAPHFRAVKAVLSKQPNDRRMSTRTHTTALRISACSRGVFALVLARALFTGGAACPFR